MAQPAATRGIPGLVRHLSSGTPAQQLVAAKALDDLLLGALSAGTVFAQSEAIAHAGGIPALVAASSSQDEELLAAHATSALMVLASNSEECANAILLARARVAVAAYTAQTRGLVEASALVLFRLAHHGQAAAVAAASPPGVAEAALQQLIDLDLGTEHTQDLQAALRNLAEARRAADAAAAAAPEGTHAAAAPAAATPAAAAPAAAAQATPPATAASAGPPRVCAAPGCGATEGCLRRCGACGTVRYCSEACRDAHWPAHRPECKRRRPAAAAAGPSTS